MFGFVKKMLGSKSDRDIKEIQPVVNSSVEIDKTLHSLSNDELRAKTHEFRKRIQEYIAPKEKEIDELNLLIDSEEIDIEEKEKMYATQDKLEKESYELTQEVLNEILPEVFAVIRETARRLVDNEYLEVTATQMDRDLATMRPGVEIVGDKAKFKSSWLAGGNMIRWDMVHYDCQLIGGIVLHQGKVAEMATGEGKTLVATLPVYLNALPGKGVHIVTVNDYLAKRDS